MLMAISDDDRVTVTASGELSTIVANIAMVIGGVYEKIADGDEEAAVAFKKAVKTVVADGAPIWE